MNINYQIEFTIDELNSLIKKMRKADKIIKKSDYLKWYESGHIKLRSIGTFAMVEVWRMLDANDLNTMDKKTKDKITSYLKKNNFTYYENRECYILLN
jgi:hypothetical protein